MDTIRVLVKGPGKPAEVREIENTLNEFQKLVGGHIEALQIGDDLCCYVNEEGKLLNLRPNFFLRGRHNPDCDLIVGPAVFFRSDFEGGETSLTLTDILYLNKFLLGSDAEGMFVNGKPLA